MKEKPSVLVNGFGTIGKRVAHAIKLQDDIKLVGISTRSPSPAVKIALSEKSALHGIDLYAINQESLEAMKKEGLEVRGTLEEVLKSGKVDIVIDCSPEGVGAQNKKNIYEKYGVKAVFQGGEKSDVAEVSFNSFYNYEEAFDKKYVRVPSCNTTGLIRTLSAIERKIPIEYVFVALVRRAADPHEYTKGPINAIEFDKHVPSHHAIDVKTVMKNLNIFSMAVKVPTTLAHVHVVDILAKRETSVEEVVNAFKEHSRIILLDSKDYLATSTIIERFRDLFRPRNDMYEVAVINGLINVEKNRIRYLQVVHQEAIVIPENVDAIRAMTGIEKNKWKSIEKTNKSLGIGA